MQQLRSLFLLQPEAVYLNHGSFGACPREVFDAYQEWQLELERQPVAFLGRRFEGLLQEARAALAQYLGAAADELVYVPNATVGLNVIARSLELKAGDEILATDHEYGAVDRTWQWVCERSGASYVRQHIPLPVTTADDFVERIWAGVTPRTRILCISHITSPTALVFPIAELIRRARAAGITTVVDGAHAPGQIPLDLDALGADFYVGNCHKWLMAPKGAGFLYARRECQPQLQPLIVSWGWRSARPGASQFIDEQEYQGTRDIAAYLAVPAAIRFAERYGWDDVRAECHRLLRYAGEQIGALTGLEPIAPLDPWNAQMASFRLPDVDTAALKSRLWEEHHIEVPLIDWPNLPMIRVSIQGYNTAADVDALVAALRALLPEVARQP